MKFKCQKSGEECEHATPQGHYIKGQYCMHDYYRPKLVNKVERCPLEKIDAKVGGPS